MNRCRVSISMLWDDSDMGMQENFLHLQDTITHIEADGHMSEDWIFDQISFYNEVREFFEDWNFVNEELTEAKHPHFRQLASQAEIISSAMDYNIRARYFHKDTYLTLLKLLIKMFKYVYRLDNTTDMHNDLDNITHMMGGVVIAHAQTEATIMDEDI